MVNYLPQFFSAVCGQNPDHSWAPGGIWLPFCQRCTGLYCGAGVAALLHLWLKPKPTPRFLAVHTGFLVLMVPFGFHWLPQGAILRSVTGVLFGFAVASFLWLPLKHSGTEPPLSPDTDRRDRTRRMWVYSLALSSTLLLVPWFGTYGGKISFAMLTVPGFWGAAALSMLILANGWLGARGALRLLF